MSVLSSLIPQQATTYWRIPKSSKINSDFPPTANAQPSKKAYSLYLWPRSKCWIRASRASIQHAATKVTNIGNKLSSKASILLRKSELIRFYFVCKSCISNCFYRIRDSLSICREITGGKDRVYDTEKFFFTSFKVNFSSGSTSDIGLWNH